MGSARQPPPPRRSSRYGWLCVLVATGCGGAVELFGDGSDRELLDSPPRVAPATGGVLILGLDGVRQRVLYDELRGGHLPGLSALLGGFEGGALPHAFLHEQALAPFPSLTAVGWAVVATGRPPAENGVTGNEMFLRPSGRFVAPVPMSTSDRGDLLAVYNDQLLDQLLMVPTLYERLHTRGQESWVATNHVHKGATRLLMPGRDDLLEGMAMALGHTLGVASDEAVYSEIDDGTFDTLLGVLEEKAPPDLLMTYATGADLLCHLSTERTDVVQRRYLREQLDGRLAELHAALARRGEWYVIVVADHGHTQVLEGDRNALEREGDDEPPEVLRRAGFRVHDGELGVGVAAEDDAVMAYQSGAAYVYLADRSRCAPEGVCDWTVPPRYEQDVLVAAEAFHRNNRDGHVVAELAGALTMVLVRRPVPFEQIDRPFEVYLGEGRTTPARAFLAAHLEGNGPALWWRLHRLAVGRHGERAGDVVLVARTGEAIGDRYYFSKPNRSAHGAAIATDSLVPFIVAHPGYSAATLGAAVGDLAGEVAGLEHVAPLAMALSRHSVEERTRGAVAPRE